MTNCRRLEQKLKSETELIYALDLYGDYAILQVYEFFEGIEKLAFELLEKYKVKGIYLKNRYDKTTENHTELLVGEKAPENYLVIENDIKFIIKFEDHLDVGLFLDHRIAREIIQKESGGKDVLNLFAYTGSFSLYANKGGANSTTTVDLSNTYCKWIKENFEANNIPVHYENQVQSNNTIWCEDTIDFLKLAEDTNETYDIIILDPPSFSRNKDRKFNVQDDHAELIKRLQDNLLRDKGFIFFSTNLKNFTLDPYIRPGAEKLTKQTIPEEFRPYAAHQSFVFYN